MQTSTIRKDIQILPMTYMFVGIESQCRFRCYLYHIDPIAPPQGTRPAFFHHVLKAGHQSEPLFLHGGDLGERARDGHVIGHVMVT